MAYISHTQGATGRTENIDGDCSLFVVATLHNSETSTVACTLDGSPLTVASGANGYVKIYYMLNPPTGSRDLEFVQTNISQVFAAQYSDIESFQAAQQAAAQQANYSPNGAGLIFHAVIGGGGSGSPISGTTQRQSTGANWYGDRIVTGSGTVAVGCSGLSDPDYAGAIFLAPAEEPEEVDASGTPTAAAPTASGSASIPSAPATPTLLDSGSTSTFTGSSASANVTVTDGAGNRKLIVGVAMEAPGVSVTGLTFNTQNLLEVDDAGIVTDGVSTCIMFEQFEAGLPASGSHQLALTLSGNAADGGRMFYWLVDSVRQDQLAVGASGQVSNSGSSTATFQTDQTFEAGEDERVLCAVGYRNDNATSLLLTTPASATLVADETVPGGGRVSGSSKVGGMGTGTVRPTWTTQASSQNRRTGAAVMLEPAEAEEPDVDASGTPTAAAPTASGSASVVVSSSGATTAAAPTASGSASPVVASSGAVSGPAPSASGSASAVVSAAGTLSALTPGASGSSSAVVGASGAPSAAPPTATGAAEGEAVDPEASGSVSAPAPGAAGSASVDVAASGSTVAAAPSASAGLGVVVSASGATDAIAPGAAGSSSVVVGASGAVAAAQPIASGSAVDPDALVSRPRATASATVTQVSARATRAVSSAAAVSTQIAAYTPGGGKLSEG